MLWGRVPYRSLPAPARAASHVASRERALAASEGRAPEGMRSHRVHRLAPPPGAAGGVRRRVRDFLYGGAVVEFVRGARPPRIADVVAAAAGVGLEERSLGLGADRAAVARARRGGQELILRMAPAGVVSDPSAAADALVRLEAAGVRGVPRLRGRGHAAGANWALESVVAGRRPRTITVRVAAQAVSFCASLPSTGGPPTALKEELGTLAELLPERAGDLDGAWHRLASLNDAAPAVLRHGDFWHGNLLVGRGGLSGVIDWDTWHASSLPGIDVLHLFYACRATRRGRRGFGDVWPQRPWRSAAFADFAGHYWQRLGFAPDPDLLDVIGVAWWTGWASRVLRRHPRLARDAKWMQHNVGSVVDAVVR